jgi:hypothetical protein
MYHVTHFLTEFIRQSQATIIPRVTMTQFLFVMGLCFIGVGLLGLPPLAVVVLAPLGYIAGYNLYGEYLYKRTLAYGRVWLKQQLGSPAIINLQAAWDEEAARMEKEG